MSTNLDKSRRRVAAGLLTVVVLGIGGVATAATVGHKAHDTTSSTSINPIAPTTTPAPAPTSVPTTVPAPAPTTTVPPVTPPTTPVAVVPVTTTTTPPSATDPVPVTTAPPAPTTETETVPSFIGQDAVADQVSGNSTWGIVISCTVSPTSTTDDVVSQSPAADTVVSGPEYEWSMFNQVTLTYSSPTC